MVLTARAVSVKKSNVQFWGSRPGQHSVLCKIELTELTLSVPKICESQRRKCRKMSCEWHMLLSIIQNVCSGHLVYAQLSFYNLSGPSFHTSALPSPAGETTSHGFQ